QKGADHKKVGALDENLKHFASIVKRDLDKDILEVPGSGAAGGLGGGLMAFLNAQLKPGFEIIKEIVDLEQKMKGADLVITGEGRIDFQTQFGKTPFGVAQVAGKFGIPVIALAGTLGDGHQVLYEQGIDAMFSILDRPMDLRSAKKDAPLLLKNTAERIMRLYRTPPKGIRG
ncbi:MAG: glycerate kinase, partial [Bacteroidetes bacterium]|nr:glycerate kinase [Bacteroidota bacterium]